MRQLLSGAGLVLVVGLTAGCGGGGGAPADASEEEFCTSYQSLLSDLDLTSEPSEADMVAALKAWAEDMLETGTPDDISDEEREGFDLTTDLVADLDDDATEEDFEALEESVSDDEQ